jgi:malate synthase
MQGSLSDTFVKNGRSVTRRLNPDRNYATPANGTLILKGRSLMLIRNVGHHMLDASVLDKSGQPAPETIVDAMVTSLIGIYDLNARRNSRTGSIYIVKPKRKPCLQPGAGSGSAASNFAPSPSPSRPRCVCTPYQRRCGFFS